MKKQLNDLSNIIGNLGITFAILIGAVLFTKETILNLYAGIPIFSSRELDILVNAFIIAVTVIVVAIPEGLPMAVTIAFAFSVDKMKKEHNLVKHLDKSEAMGNVNNVCTDKTGTLTLGVMRIAAFFIEDEDIRLNKAKVQDENLRSLIWNCIFKNITCVESVNDKGEKVLNGDMTEKALYTYLKENGYSLEGNRKGKYVLPFKSDYKYMMNIYKEEEGRLIYINGNEYEGSFAAGLQNGKGKLTQTDGEAYEGYWKNGKMHGQGIRTHSNGDKYIGNHFNNVRNGKGAYYFANGDSYNGDWVNGNANGEGVLNFRNGDVYYGEFIKNNICGKGKFTKKNGDIYTGNFINGLINGNGKYENVLGEQYIGGFVS